MPTRDHLVMCPVPAVGGGDCWNEVHPASRHGLCASHWKEVVQDWVDDAPRMEHPCPQCGAFNTFDPIYWASARCGRCLAHMSRPEVVLEARRRREEERRAEAMIKKRISVVYYVKFVDLVKIGFSTNLPERVKAIPHDEVLAIEPGGFAEEHARHQQFAADLVPGQFEWFRSSPGLMLHIERLRVEHGTPKQYRQTGVVRDSVAARVV